MEKRNEESWIPKTNYEVFMICERCQKSHILCPLDLNCECCKITLEKIKQESENQEFNLLYRYLKNEKNKNNEK